MVKDELTSRTHARLFVHPPPRAQLLWVLLLAAIELGCGVALLRAHAQVPVTDDAGKIKTNTKGEWKWRDCDAMGWGIAHVVLGAWTAFWCLVALRRLQKRGWPGERPNPKAQAARARKAAAAAALAQASEEIELACAARLAIELAPVQVGRVVEGRVVTSTAVPTISGMARPPLAEACEVLRRELGLPAGASMPDVVSRACAELGLEPDAALGLVGNASRCHEMLVGRRVGGWARENV